MTSFEQELADHLRPLRAVARLLVGDHAADDLLQETSLLLVRRPPPGEAPLRGWALAILRRRGQQLRRSDSQRRARESASAAAWHAEALDRAAAPAQIAAQQETVARLHRALQALPEPYRSTLWQRFFMDQTPGAIAERTGTPLPTVKSRLQRGLELLRRDFAGDRDEPSWRSALAGAFAIEPAPTAAAATAASGLIGFAIMTTTFKIGLAATAAAGIWLLTRWSELTPPIAAAPTLAAAPGAAAGTVEVDATAAATAARTMLATDADRPAPTRRARVVDQDTGAPLPHYAVRIAEAAGDPDRGELLVADERGELWLPQPRRESSTAVIALDDPTDPIAMHVSIPVDGNPPADAAPLPLAVPTGPTCVLLFVDGPPPATVLRAALLEGSEVVFSNHRLHDGQAVRDGDRPWVRFDPQRVAPGHPGGEPWTLVVWSDDPSWYAQGTLPSLADRRPVPVELRSHPCGRIRVQATIDGAATATGFHASVYRRSAAGEPTGRDRTVHFDGSGQLDLVPPGDYRVWVGSRNHAARGIDATVRAGETTEVKVDFARVEGLSTLRVVARTQSGERPIGTVWFRARRPGSRDTVSGTHVSGTGSPHLATCEFRDLAAGEWDVEVGPTPHLPPWDSRTKRVLASAGTVEFVCLDVGAPPTVHVEIEVVDAAGRPLQASTTTLLDGRPFMGSFTGEDGRESLGPCLAGQPLQVFVNAPGCSPVLTEVVAAAQPAGERLRVVLSPGWGTLFTVFCPGPDVDPVPLDGVDIVFDGVLVATTDQRGLALVLRDTAPRRVELRRAGYTVRSGAVDPATGRLAEDGARSPSFVAMHPVR